MEQVTEKEGNKIRMERAEGGYFILGFRKASKRGWYLKIDLDERRKEGRSQRKVKCPESEAADWDKTSYSDDLLRKCIPVLMRVWIKENPVHCWWECKLVHTAIKKKKNSMWHFLKNFKVHLPLDQGMCFYTCFGPRTSPFFQMDPNCSCPHWRLLQLCWLLHLRGLQMPLLQEELLFLLPRGLCRVCPELHLQRGLRQGQLLHLIPGRACLSCR